MHRTFSARATGTSGAFFRRTARRALAATVLTLCCSAQAQVPFISELRAFAFGYCPKGWAPAQGASLPLAQNTALYALVGTRYGGNGINTLGLPDLRGRSPVGAGTSQGSSYVTGEWGGQETLTLTQPQMPAHQHTQIATAAPATHATPSSNAALAQTQNAGLYVDSSAANTAMTTASVGGGQPVSTRDPFLAITWCVATTGAYPSSE